MDESKKKLIKIAVIVGCLVLAASIFLIQGSKSTRGIDSIKRGQMIWVKCNDPKCKVEYQMDKKDYFEYIEGHINPFTEKVPPLICRDCRKESVYRAVKCEGCGTVFFYGTVSIDYPDRCPKCRFSQMEKDRIDGTRHKQ